MTRAEYAVAQPLAIAATAVAAKECEGLERFSVFAEDGAVAAEMSEGRVQTIGV